MGEEILKTLFQNMGEERIQKIEKTKEDNKTIKNKIIVEIVQLIDYLEELKEGKHINYQASDKYPSLFDLNKHLIWSCIEQASIVKRIIERIDTESENLNYLVSVSIPLSNMIKEYNEENYYLMPNDLAVSQASLNAIESFITALKHDKENYNRIITDEIRNIMHHAEGEVKRFKRLRNIADNAKTENIYNNAVVKYQGLEKDYRKYFYWAIFITVVTSLSTFFLKKNLVPDLIGNTEFWAIKIAIIALGITLITYFLKQSLHYQRLADQNYQTQVELQAYPSFMESIPTEEAASVRKELALKYFGREIDGATHKDMSNLISDQMKSTTDMVKAATEAIKSLSGKGGT